MDSLIGSLPVLFNTGTVTEDCSSFPNVAFMLILLSIWTTMLSSAVKQGPLILMFVPPNIIPERGERVKVLDPESENVKYQHFP